MPYLILIAGLLLGLYGLYRFFLGASPEQVRALFRTAAITVLTVALLFMALTERLGAALILFILTLPATLPWLRRKLAGKNAAQTPPPELSAAPMDRKEALAVLGLEDENATDAAVRGAHKKLIKKLHPDQEGSA